MRIRAYFSHKYEAYSINAYFYQLLAEKDAHTIQFEVDAGRVDGKKIPTNLTRIERKVRDADAFVGVFPLPREAHATPTKEYLRKQSQYLRLELDMALRAGLPSVVFLDERYGDLFGNSENLHKVTFDSREFPNDVRTVERRRFEKCAGNFFEQVSGWINYKQRSTRKGLVGVILNTTDYDQTKRTKIWESLEEFHWSPELLPWPPQLQNESYFNLERFDWILTDSGRVAENTSIVGTLFSKMIPMMRLRKGFRRSSRLDSANHVVFGGFEVGYGDHRKEACWTRPDEMIQVLRKLLETLDTESTLIANRTQAEDYFRCAAELDVDVFFSCAGSDLDFAGDLAAALKKRFKSVFYYKHPGDLTPGTQWMRQITNRIETAGLGIILCSQAWIDSPYCEFEGDLILRSKLNRKIGIIPVKRTQDSPDIPELKGITYVKPWNFEDNPEKVSEFIARSFQISKEVA